MSPNPACTGAARVGFLSGGLFLLIVLVSTRGPVTLSLAAAMRRGGVRNEFLPS